MLRGFGSSLTLKMSEGRISRAKAAIERAIDRYNDHAQKQNPPLPRCPGSRTIEYFERNGMPYFNCHRCGVKALKIGTITNMSSRVVG
mmetsp:Transcript_32573/g.50701  ORF Transcript_32573/g.50701 Transcript_32573/m.50701 type:complete len:88 (+) Transcript_32573:302-565(+)